MDTRTDNPKPPQDGAIAELARAVDCLTEEQVMLLADASASTVKNWRKRGIGPAYTLIGNRPLYPRAALVEFIAKNVRERKTGPGPSVL